VLDPEVVVALGATAAKALFGPSFRVTRSRGVLLPWPSSAADPAAFTHDDDAARESAFAVATIHPSAVLRAHNRDEAYGGLVADLRVAAKTLAA
jgi:DNA polymerase